MDSKRKKQSHYFVPKPNKNTTEKSANLSKTSLEDCIIKVPEMPRILANYLDGRDALNLISTCSLIFDTMLPYVKNNLILAVNTISKTYTEVYKETQLYKNFPITGIELTTDSDLKLAEIWFFEFEKSVTKLQVNFKPGMSNKSMVVVDRNVLLKLANLKSLNIQSCTAYFDIHPHFPPMPALQALEELIFDIDDSVLNIFKVGFYPIQLLIASAVNLKRMVVRKNIRRLFLENNDFKKILYLMCGLRLLQITNSNDKESILDCKIDKITAFEYQGGYSNPLVLVLIYRLTIYACRDGGCPLDAILQDKVDFYEELLQNEHYCSERLRLREFLLSDYLGLT